MAISSGGVNGEMRPVIGHEGAKELLRRAVARGRLAQAYLFSGPAGIGKGALALRFAQMLLCQGAGDAPCLQCPPCRKVERGIHPDLRLIEAEGKVISIDQIREEIQQEVALKPYEAQYKIYIISNFQRATLAAANCLLKTLEEPPRHAVLILTTTEAAELPPTIVSRCQVVRLRPPTVPEIAAGLEHYCQVENSQAKLLARLCGGRTCWALAAAHEPQLLEERRARLEKLREMSKAGLTERLKYAQELSSSHSALREVLGLWQTWWRDLLLLSQENGDAIVNIDWKEQLEELARGCGRNEIVTYLGAIQRTARLLNGNVNARLALEVLLLELPAPAGLG